MRFCLTIRPNVRREKWTRLVPLLDLLCDRPCAHIRFCSCSCFSTNPSSQPLPTLRRPRWVEGFVEISACQMN